jgi:hypothetical protein
MRKYILTYRTLTGADGPQQEFSGTLSDAKAHCEKLYAGKADAGALYVAGADGWFLAKMVLGGPMFVWRDILQ